MHRSTLLAAIAVMLVSAAHAEIVVIGNPAAPAMSKDEIAQFFLGKNQVRIPGHLDR